MYLPLQDGRIDQVQPILLTELYGWSCWRFNIAVKVQQQQQEVFYTINVDPFGHRQACTHICVTGVQPVYVQLLLHCATSSRGGLLHASCDPHAALMS